MKADGTVVAVGSNSSHQCKVDKWTDIAAISAGYDHTVGLKADGTVIATGKNKNGQCDVSYWREIAIPEEEIFEPEAEASMFPLTTVRGDTTLSAGGYNTVGLKTDGTVLAAGIRDYGMCGVGDWTDIALPPET